MAHVNVEIKACCTELPRIKDILREHHADYKGTDHQIDTYFQTPRGRLKLREGNIENYLVYYERNNQAGPKQSDVILFPNPPGSTLKEILTRAYGELITVDKYREIYFIDNVKFHLDTIYELGQFVEIEAIDKQGNIEKDILHEQCKKYTTLFGITEGELVSESYSDLLLWKKGKGLLNARA